jgi:predicted RNase H-like nuclease (RuvC/YqgF family)
MPQLHNPSSQSRSSQISISNLKSQISNLKSQISNLKSQISNLKSQISNFGSNLRFEILGLAQPQRGLEDFGEDELCAKRARLEPAIQAGGERLPRGLRADRRGY